MTLLDTLVICAMALGLVVWIGEPLLRREAPPHSSNTEEESTAALLLQKETLYTALRDLDFDYQTGKVDSQDYAELRQQLENEALQLLRQIDLVDPLARLDAEIDAQVARVKDATSLLAGQTSLSGCPHCQAARIQEAHFCPFCGRALRV
ncbi:MAG: hypothetical protein AB7N91_07395 [Candidatus Tectimicrobiota bacterium]